MTCDDEGKEPKRNKAGAGKLAWPVESRPSLFASSHIVSGSLSGDHMGMPAREHGCERRKKAKEEKEEKRRRRQGNSTQSISALPSSL